jgi:hypothetical protein
MNNLNDISEYIDTIPLGEPVYDISLSYGDDINMRMKDWEAKEELKCSDNWLDYQIGKNLHRKFNKETRKMELIDKEDLLNDIKYHVANYVPVLVKRTSPAEQPKRTKVYKELENIGYNNRKNDNFINDMIPIMNYFQSHVENGTESTEVHRKNVFGLLDILRKKYGKSSS